MDYQDKPLSVQEAADALYISKNTVYDLIHKNELASYRVGRKVRIDRHSIEDYINKSKSESNVRLVGQLHTPPSSAFTSTIATPASVPIAAPNDSIIISGQDMLLDILAQYLQRPPYSFRVLRSFIGSYDSLTELYRGKVTVSSAHLWDGTNNEYNVPFIKYILPGISCQIVNLVYRMQGFFVAKGNPKNIQTWEDLTRPDVLMLNREKGCGVRVLIDGSLQKHGISPAQIKGYDKWGKSHIALASAVSRGEADVAVGNQKSARQVENIDFVPIQKERVDLVIPMTTQKVYIDAIIEVLNSQAFHDEVSGIGDYDISETGTLIAET